MPQKVKKRRKIQTEDGVSHITQSFMLLSLLIRWCMRKMWKIFVQRLWSWQMSMLNLNRIFFNAFWFYLEISNFLISKFLFHLFFCSLMLDGRNTMTTFSQTRRRLNPISNFWPWPRNGNKYRKQPRQKRKRKWAELPDCYFLFSCYLQCEIYILCINVFQ